MTEERMTSVMSEVGSHERRVRAIVETSSMERPATVRMDSDVFGKAVSRRYPILIIVFIIVFMVLVIVVVMVIIIFDLMMNHSVLLLLRPVDGMTSDVVSKIISETS
jgi:cellobiose-specific phosphotransferase system component IIC